MVLSRSLPEPAVAKPAKKSLRREAPSRPNSRRVAPRRGSQVLDTALAEKRGTFPGCKALKSHEMGLESRGMRGGDGGVKFRRFGGHTGSCRHQSRRTLRRTPWWAMQGSNLRP